MKKTLLLTLTCLLALSFGAMANASTLSIQFSGMDLHYDGNNLMASEDYLTTMNFFDCGVLVGTLTENIGVNMFVGDLGPILYGNGSYQSSTGYGFDLYIGGEEEVSTAAGGDIGGGGIGLDWDSPVQVNVNQNGGSTQVSVLGSASTSQINYQNLPFGFELDSPIQVSFSTQITKFTLVNETVAASTESGDYFATFDAFGTGEVSGDRSPIPEPMTLLTMGLGLAGFGALRRRKKA